jgi:hypothetical protein
VRGVFFAAVTSLLAGGLAGCSPSPRQRGESAPAPASVATAASEDDFLPGRSTYAGSARCGECHGKNHERWQSDWHARALAEARPGAVAGSWAGVHYKGDSSEAWMMRQGEHYVVRTRDAAGELADRRVGWVIGGKRMQDPLTVLPDGRWQVLPVYYHVTGRGEWVDYNEAKQGRVTPEHPFFWTNFRRTANRECLDCHVTGLDVRYDRASHGWTTTFVDAGVACESCHGPGGRHAETKEKGDIVQPRKLDAERGLALCAQCHGPRNPVFPILDAAHRFRPGERYEDRYEVYVITTGGPERSLDFFADGRPKSSSYEYQALLQSRCYRKGGATCLTCHTAPHADHGPDDLKRSAGDAAPLGDQSCRGCHPALFADVAGHSHHRAPEAQSCVACHMPRIVPGVLDLFADHALDVPVPENTDRHGVPNACNACHAKATPQAMADAIHRWYPDAESRSARRRRLAEALDPQVTPRTGDALEAVAADREEAPSLRGAAATLLVGERRHAAAATLTQLLADPSDVVRGRAAAALGRLGAKAAVRPLVPLLRDASLSVRRAAALALAFCGAPEGEQALRQLASDPASDALPQPHLALATLAARRGDFGEAAAQLERSLALQPYQVDALVMLADVEARRGRWASVEAQLQEALRFDPRHEPARQRLIALSARGATSP